MTEGKKISRQIKKESWENERIMLDLLLAHCRSLIMKEALYSGKILLSLEQQNEILLLLWSMEHGNINEENPTCHTQCYAIWIHSSHLQHNQLGWGKYLHLNFFFYIFLLFKHSAKVIYRLVCLPSNFFFSLTFFLAKLWKVK